MTSVYIESLAEEVSVKCTAAGKLTLAKCELAGSMFQSSNGDNTSACNKYCFLHSEICIAKFFGNTLFFFCFRYAMKCLDKKRIKMKGGETLALNERIMLSLVSTGVS